MPSDPEMPHRPHGDNVVVVLAPGCMRHLVLARARFIIAATVVIAILSIEALRLVTSYRNYERHRVSETTSLLGVWFVPRLSHLAGALMSSIEIQGKTSCPFCGRVKCPSRPKFLCHGIRPT